MFELPMAGLEPARANYSPTDFKSVASTIPPHRLLRSEAAILPMKTPLFEHHSL
jgi:hypothetical protein